MLLLLGGLFSKHCCLSERKFISTNLFLKILTEMKDKKNSNEMTQTKSTNYDE